MRRFALLLAAALVAAPGPARACALELILAIDVSGSVDPREYRLQSEGTADAFRNGRLVEAILALEGGMLVAVTQWSGASRQALAVEWRHLESAEAIAALADEVAAMPRAYRHYSTAIGEALRHAAEVSRTAPLTCRRRVIDLSGDGVSNEGDPPSWWRDALAGAGYVINGLAIRGAEPDPVAHYRAEVIAGGGSFVESAEGFADYPRAILRKLLREIGGRRRLSRADAPALLTRRGAPGQARGWKAR